MDKNTAHKKTVMLIILDGWGYREETEHNAVAAAQTPFFNSLWKKYPHSLLKASGHAVGLPEGQIGNSEVGHTTIGAGSILDTDLVRVDKDILSGKFQKNPAFLALFDHVKKHNSTLHVQGILSPGGVHGHENHLFEFLRLAKKAEMKKVAIHVFTDGRDVAPQSASQSIKRLEALIKDLGPEFFIATISGRYYAMDRDNNWDRLAKVERAIFECEGNVCEIRPSAYMEEQYKTGKVDELLEPIVCATMDGHGCAIKKGDGIFFSNFRADRARMITKKLIERKKELDLYISTLTEYSTEFDAHAAYPPKTVDATLAEEISKAGMKQAHIAETEKYNHVTYFFNGWKEKPYPGEEHIMLPSRKDVKTHDEAPEMRAEGIADAAIAQIEKGVDFILVNFANPDMVGHTANVPAIVKAVETVDTQLERVITALDKKGGVAFITADHGNAEINFDPETNTRHTAHTTSPVPAIITRQGHAMKDGGLSDIAPTILQLLGLKPSHKMSGKSLIIS
jgi:2,3-bisphosphoglycerate-independent phosphoglycerate mutase